MLILPPINPNLNTANEIQPAVLNIDSWQARGLIGWFPFGDNRDFSIQRRSSGIPVVGGTRDIRKPNKPDHPITRTLYTGVDSRARLGTIDAAHPLSLVGTDFTITFWVIGLNGPGDNDFPRIIDKSDGGAAANGWCIYTQVDSSDYKSAVYYLAINGSTSVNTAIGHIPWGGNNSWQHIAVAFRAGTTNHTWYLNGTSLSNFNQINVSVPATTTQAAIANWNHSTIRALEGYLSDIRIYNSAFGVDKVRQIYQNGKELYKYTPRTRYFHIPEVPTPTLRVVPVKRTTPKERPAEFDLNSDSTFARGLNGAFLSRRPGSDVPFHDAFESQNQVGWNTNLAGNYLTYDNELRRQKIVMNGGDFLFGDQLRYQQFFQYPITLSAWCKVFNVDDATGEIGGIFGIGSFLGGDSSSSWEIIVVRGKFWATNAEGNAGSNAATVTPLEVNRWYHVCGTFESGTHRAIYLNGKLEATNTADRDPTQSGFPTPRLFIGTRVASHVRPDQNLNGEVADPYWWNRILSDEEIYQLATTKQNDLILPRSRSYHVIPAAVPTPTLRVVPVKKRTLKDRPERFVLNHDSPQAKGLIHYWSCNEGWTPLNTVAGSFSDAIIDSVSNYHATAPRSIQYQNNKTGIGNPYLGSVYRLNTAFSEDAPTRWVFPNDAFDNIILGANATFSWSFWAQIIDTAPAQTGFILGRFTGNNGRQIIFSVGTDTLIFRTYSNPADSGSGKLTSTPIDTDWHLVTAVVDEPANIHRLYLDDDLVDENSAAHTGAVQVNMPFTFGCNSEDVTQNRFNGRIADVRLYNRALTESDVKAIYHDPWDLHRESSYFFIPAEPPTPPETTILDYLRGFNRGMNLGFNRGFH